MSIEDGSKSGWPSTSMDDDHIDKVLAVIRKNHRLTVHNLILTNKLKMCRVATKFVPRLLTDAQKENRVTVSQELFDHSNSDENFLKNVR